LCLRENERSLGYGFFHQEGFSSACLVPIPIQLSSIRKPSIFKSMNKLFIGLTAAALVALALRKKSGTTQIEPAVGVTPQQKQNRVITFYKA
jgi:hypothetical protein